MKLSGRIETVGAGWLLACGLVLTTALLVGAQAKPAKTAEPAAQATPAPTATYVGSASCKACHAKVWEPWPDSPHGKALSDDTLPAEIKGCEACHGAASIHISTGAQNKPRVPKGDDAARTNSVCGACHFLSDKSKAPEKWQTLSRRYFARSMHGRKGLSCVSCHAGHANGNDKALIQPARDLCLSCHGQLLESSPGKKAAYTHSPVAQGQCLTCHDPHGSSDRGMLTPGVQKTCQGCHDPSDAKTAAAHQGYPITDSKCTSCHDPHSHDKGRRLVREKQHGPFKQGKCEICHTKPVSGEPIGLVKPAKELCFSCHPASVMIPEGDKAHLPVKEGLCTACHNPHVSSEKALLKTRPANTCFGCHSKVEDDTVMEHRHKVLDASMNCMLCHRPHSSKQENLLNKEQVALCSQCHKHSFSHPISKRTDGTVVNDPTTGKMMVCTSCHDIHGSTFEELTKAEKGRELCVRCHDKQEH